MNKLLQWDREAMLYLNNLGTDFWDPFWINVSEVWPWIPLYALLLFLVFRYLRGGALLAALAVVLLNVLLTDQGSTWLFKEQFERLRPCHQESLAGMLRLPGGRCGGQFGFLSAHAANSFGIAVLVGSLLRPHLPWLRNALLIWAAFLAYSRVYLGVHFPLDILAGALYGSTCGILSFHLNRSFALRK